MSSHTKLNTNGNYTVCAYLGQRVGGQGSIFFFFYAVLGTCPLVSPVGGWRMTTKFKLDTISNDKKSKDDQPQFIPFKLAHFRSPKSTSVHGTMSPKPFTYINVIFLNTHIKLILFSILIHYSQILITQHEGMSKFICTCL